MFGLTIKSIVCIINPWFMVFLILDKVVRNGKQIYIESLEDLRIDNENYGRPERVKMIEEKIKNAFGI